MAPTVQPEVIDMQTKAKSNSIITHELSDAGVLTFMVKGAGSFTFDPAMASEVCRKRAAIHGFIQRISDGGALGRDTTTGRPASPEDKRARMERIAQHYASGSVEWSIARAESSGPGLDTLLLAAVAEVRGVTVERVRELIAAGAAKRDMKPGAYLALAAAADAIAPIVTRMKAERAAASGLNANDILDDMDDEEEALM